MPLLGMIWVVPEMDDSGAGCRLVISHREGDGNRLSNSGVSARARACACVCVC